MKDIDDMSEAPQRQPFGFTTDATSVDSEHKFTRKLPINSKDDVWSVRTLKENSSQRQYERGYLKNQFFFGFVFLKFC